MDVTVEIYLERYRSLGLGGSPCSAAEVAALICGSDVNLPAAYVAYLLIAGKQPPSRLVGSNCTIGHLPNLHGGADELLAENSQPPLPPQAFVFWMHQGYQFCYFIADGCKDDPPVFYYLENEATTVQKYKRLSDFVAAYAGEGHVA